jgi:hypothetical protein
MLTDLVRKLLHVKSRGLELSRMGGVVSRSQQPVQLLIPL